MACRTVLEKEGENNPSVKPSVEIGGKPVAIRK